MALTRVSGQVIKSNTDLTVGVLTATTASFTTVSVAGTITYDDVTNVDSVGLITARSGVNITSGGLIVTGISTVSAGTTSAPSISPSGDSNTGIFFPAADTIAFAEGGAEAARFDSSGRLLVGTSSARANLFNASASAQLQIEGTDGNNSAILIARNSNDTAPPNFHLAKSRGTSVGSNTVVQNNDLIGRITFTGSDGTEFVDAAFIEASVDGTPGANDMPGRLVFSTTADGASSPTERMRLDSSGRLGVGTSSPDGYAGNFLQVHSTTDRSSIRLTNSNSGSTKDDGFEIENRAGFVQVNYRENGYMEFLTNNTAAMRIDSSQRVGIGTSAPSSSLHISASVTNTSGAGSEILRIANTRVNTGTSGAGLLFVTNEISGSNQYSRAQITGEYDGASDVNGRLLFATANTSGTLVERMRIDASGRLGIGTTSPGARLGIEAPGTALLNLYDTTYAAELTIDSAATNVVRLRTGTGDDLAIHTNGSEKARLTSDGKWLVGTSSASFSTTVKLQGNSGSSTGESRIRLCRGTASPANGDTLAILGFSDNTETPSAEIAAQRDGGTWSASSVPGRLVFSTTADGASSPTERMRITSGGNLIVAGITPGAAGSIALRGDGLLQSKPVYGFAVSVSTRAMYMDTDGFLGYITSVRESKTNIEAQSNVDWLYQLQPVSFNYKSKDRETGEYIGVDPQPQFGLIAEDVEGVCPELCFYDQTESGKELRGVQYEKLITPMLKALQQANQRIETLEAEVAALKAQ